MRQLGSRLNHTKKHNRERFATQVTLVCRFVYCLLPHLRFRQQADRQGTLQQPNAQQSLLVASLNMPGSSGGVDDSRMDPAATGGVAYSSGSLGSILPVEGNGGPGPGMGGDGVTYADTDVAVSGGANTTHIPMAGLEAKEDFDFDAMMKEYVDLEGNGDGCWIGPRYH